MRAIRFEAFGPPTVLQAVTVPDPEPREGELLVQIHASAINHLDLDERAGVSGFQVHAEHQLGREGAGVVIAVGAGVDSQMVGRRVIVSGYRGCWRCRQCLQGRINVCENQTRLGIDIPGTYAELLAVPESGVFELPENVSFEQGACLQLGLGTAWHALIRRAELRAGETVLVSGAGGGVGSAGVQVAVLAGAQVIAVASTPERRKLALSLGATHAIARDQEIHTKVMQLTDGRGVDVVFDGSGGSFLQTGLSVLDVDGRYVLYGSHAGDHSNVDVIAFFRSYGSLISSRGWLIEDMKAVISEVALGRLAVAVKHRWPLGAAALAHQEFESGHVLGKGVLIP